MAAGLIAHPRSADKKDYVNYSGTDIAGSGAGCGCRGAMQAGLPSRGANPPRAVSQARAAWAGVIAPTPRVAAPERRDPARRWERRYLQIDVMRSPGMPLPQTAVRVPCERLTSVTIAVSVSPGFTVFTVAVILKIVASTEPGKSIA